MPNHAVKKKAPTKSSAPSSSAADSLSDGLSDSLIPPAPAMAPRQRTLPEQAHGVLEKSEALGGHARKEHDGNDHAYLDGRGKKVATSFMSTYDQDKSFASFMQAGAGSTYLGTKNQPTKTVKKGKNKGKVIPANDIHDGDASYETERKAKGWGTTPLARVSEQQSDGSYKHYNAKVKGGFAKFIHEGGQTRAQTFFPNDYEKLEQPLPGGDVPDSVVQGDTIEDVKGQLRKTTTDERHGDAVGKVVEAPKAQAKRSVPPGKPANWHEMSKTQKRRWNKKNRK